MKPAPNTYELPEGMKREGVRPVPPQKCSLETLSLKLLLATLVCFVPSVCCLWLVGMGEGQFSYLMVPVVLLLLLWLLGILLTFVSALLGIVRGVGVLLNGMVLSALLAYLSFLCFVVF